jgi:hypothetical protein
VRGVTVEEKGLEKQGDEPVTKKEDEYDHLQECDLFQIRNSA